MITMETPLRPSWRRHSRAVATTTTYNRSPARMTQIACMLSSIDVCSALLGMPTMTCTAVAVQQMVDRTSRGAFNRPF
jgi:hypothetical protein